MAEGTFEIEVRAANADDADGVAAVEAEAIATLRTTYRPTSGAVARRAHLDERLARLVATGRIASTIERVKTIVVGTVLYRLDGDALVVTGMGVAATWRRHGVARALVRHLARIGRDGGAAKLRLFTVLETGNVEIFTRLGFVVVDERTAELFERDDAAPLTEVTMECPLVLDRPVLR